MTTYGQFCPIAKAMEVLDERWTLLVVRELLLGPKRFADIQDGLSGISPNVLRSEERRVGKECRSRWSPYH